MMMPKVLPNSEEVEFGEGLESRRVLVLNQGYLPTNLVGWKQAVTSVFLEKAELIKAYSIQIRAVKKSYPLPSVIRLREFAGNPFVVPKFSRRNVYIRDRMTCQYCGRKREASKLNLDHIIPISKGGVTGWDNVVCCCKSCNRKKGDSLPSETGMKLIRPVKAPQNSLYLKLRERRFPPDWSDFLYFRKLGEKAGTLA